MAALQAKEAIDIYNSQEFLNEKYEPIEFCLENRSLQRQTIRLFGGSIHPPTIQNNTSSIQNNFINLTERDYERITFNEANGFVYMYDNLTTAFVKVNPTAGTTTTPFGSGLGTIGDIVYHSNNQLLYRLHRSSTDVTVTDSNDNQITTIPLPAGLTGGLGVISVPSRNEIWAVARNAVNFEVIIKINAITNTVVSSLSIGLGGFLDLAYNSNNDFIYILTTQGGARVKKTDTTTLAQTNIALGGVQAVRRIVYNPDDTNIYVQRASDINTIDVNDNVTTLPAPFSSQTTDIFGLYHNPDDGFIYVGDGANNNQYFVWDWDTNSIVETVVTNADGGSRNARDIISDATGNVYVCFFGTVAVDGGQLSVVSPLSPVIQTVGGSTVDFDEKIREIQFNPIKINHFKLVASRSTQFNNLVKYKKVSTAGKTYEETYNPQKYVDAINRDRVVIEFPDMDGLIFDGTKFIEFDIDSKEFICLYFYKEQYKIFEVLQNPYLMNPDEVCLMSNNESYFNGTDKKKRICVCLN